MIKYKVLFNLPGLENVVVQQLFKGARIYKIIAFGPISGSGSFGYSFARSIVENNPKLFKPIRTEEINHWFSNKYELKNWLGDNLSEDITLIDIDNLLIKYNG